MSHKNLVTRRKFLVQAGAAGVAAFLAACAQPSSAPQPTVKPAEEGTAASTAIPPAAAPEPTSAPPVELLYYFIKLGGEANWKDLDLVQAEMSKIMQERFNATIKLQPFPYADYAQKMNVKNAAGEQYDLCFTSNWINHYQPNVKNGVFLDITDLLPQLAPKYYGGLNPAAWVACKVKGRIYAAVNQQIWAATIGPICRKDLADKYPLDLGQVTRYEDLEPWFQAVLEGEAGKVAPIWSDDAGTPVHGSPWWTTYYNLDKLPGDTLVYSEDQTVKARPRHEVPEWLECMALTRKWYQAGYYTKEPIPSAEMDAAVKAGKYGMIFHSAKPGIEAEQKAAYGFDWVSKILSRPWLGSDITATMTGVCNKSANPEASVRYIELINTDKAFYNLFCKGIEGKHWVWTNKEKEVIGFAEGLTAESSPYNPNSDWQFGDQFNAYYVSEAQVGSWEATRKLNDSGIASALLGFVPDAEPVKNEVAAIEAAMAEYRFIDIGLLDVDKVVPEIEAKMQQAGQDKVVAELQKQLDAWKSSS